MTLCVAAECVHDGEARFVFAKDFAVQTEISSAEKYLVPRLKRNGQA